MAANFFGADANLNQNAQSWAKVTVCARKDKFVELGAYQITVSAVTVEKGAGVATPLVEGVDDVVNSRLGMIMLLGASTIAAEGDQLSVTYNTAAITGGNVMSAITKSSVRSPGAIGWPKLCRWPPLHR